MNGLNIKSIQSLNFMPVYDKNQITNPFAHSK